jgi:ADP-heptose:LPS heptosyltransferase
MDKNFKIFSGRASLIGDTVMFLPVLNYLELKYPNSYKIFPISKKTSQSAPLFINHPLIDRIHVLKEHESLSQEDRQIINTCDISINPFPNHPKEQDWYNYFNCVEETFRMAGLDINLYHSMPENLKKPKLEKWFKIQRSEKTIAIWPFACYGLETDRNPTIKWWKDLLKILDKDYKILHFGAEIEPDLGEGLNNYTKLTHLSFLEMIQKTLGCDLCIDTDSGSSWVIGAYGFPQINLVLKNAHNHFQKFDSFAPENYLNNKIDLIGLDGKDCINTDQILDAVKKLYVS